LFFFLKGTKVTERLFKFGLPSHSLSKVEAIEVYEISKCATILFPQVIEGRRAYNFTAKSEHI
jgi:hypothetical protein